MNTKIWQPIQLLALALMGLMALTRFHHFGSAFSLPDASLAVFFLAGMGVSGLWFFALLLLEAGVIDYLAIAQFNVSDYCISPAYACLIPTYAVMWLAGRYCNLFKSLYFVDSLKIFGLATFAASIAFVISNGSFYLFSGKFGQLSFAEYLARTIQYYPLYLSSTLIYAVLGLAIFKVWSVTRKMAVDAVH
jgi:hypothetical protein